MCHFYQECSDSVNAKFVQRCQDRRMPSLTSRQHPNILFIAVDDLRPEIHCYGKKKLVTPNLDRLAASGMRFDRAYCQFPQCMPSRTSLLSGVRPEQFCTWHEELCPNGEPSLPRHFKNQGYETISIGKISHKNTDDPEAWSKRHEETFREQRQGGVNGYCSGYQLSENIARMLNYGQPMEANEKSRLLPSITECVDAPDQRYPDGMIADLACAHLNRLATIPQPFFLALGFYRPHLPFAIPEKYWALYDRGEVDLAANPFLPEEAIGISHQWDLLHYGDQEIAETYSDLGHYDETTFPVLSEAKQRELIHGYWASVSFMDAQLGKVLDQLEATGQADETIILLWGDNGFHLGEHRFWSKVTHFEESTRVPLIASVPGQTSGNATSALVELVDLYPTLCELAGLPTPGHLEGTSFVPILQEPERPWKEAIFSITHRARTIRTAEFRLTSYDSQTVESDRLHLPRPGIFRPHLLTLEGHGDLELFDLKNDPAENHNVARQPAYGDKAGELKQQLDAGWRPIAKKLA